MKTFGLFMLIWVPSLIVTFIGLEDGTHQEILKIILGTQLAYILYRLLKEEHKL